MRVIVEPFRLARFRVTLLGSLLTSRSPNCARREEVKKVEIRSLLPALILFFASGEITGCAASAALNPALSVREGTLDAQVLERVDCIAVLPFENHSLTHNAGALVAQEIASSLATSERFNVVTPGEAGRLLSHFDTHMEPTNRVVLAKEYGDQLGVQGVVIGSVFEFGRRDLTVRTAAAEPVVGFLARMVETKSGRVVWTSTTSNYDYRLAIAIPESPGVVLQQAVGGTVESLIANRSVLASRGLCARAYAALDGASPRAGVVGEIVRVGASGAERAEAGEAVASAALSETGLMGPAEPPALTEPKIDDLPALTESGAAEDVPALPDMDGAGEDVPALPDMNGAGEDVLALPDMDGAGEDVLALPDMDGIEGVPALPGVSTGEEEQPIPDIWGPETWGGQAGIGLPDVSSPVDDEEAEPTASEITDEDPASMLPAKSPGKPPKSVSKKVKGRAKRLLKKIYEKKPTTLKVKLPKKVGKAIKLDLKTKKWLKDLAAVLKGAKGMRVRLDVKVHLEGMAATVEQAREIAEKAGQLMIDHLSGRHNLDPDQVFVKSIGTAKRKKRGKVTAKATVAVVVLRYP